MTPLQKEPHMLVRAEAVFYAHKVKSVTEFGEMRNRLLIEADPVAGTGDTDFQEFQAVADWALRQIVVHFVIDASLPTDKAVESAAVELLRGSGIDASILWCHPIPDEINPVVTGRTSARGVRRAQAIITCADADPAIMEQLAACVRQSAGPTAPVTCDVQLRQITVTFTILTAGVGDPDSRLRLAASNLIRRADIGGSVSQYVVSFLPDSVPSTPLETIQSAAVEAFREQLLRHTSDDGTVDQHVIATLVPRLPAPGAVEGVRESIVDALTEAMSEDETFDPPIHYPAYAERYADRILGRG
ncbi:hypothetical protein ACFVAJ_17615 [Agromyces sp. NPDC057679]|uniref:hypothetical protein n=1 Tax=Agromyces sp. NPDC057679 TaxID=3346207 RepID=UPI00366D1D22